MLSESGLSSSDGCVVEALVLIGCPVMMDAVIPPSIWLAASSVSCILKLLLRALLTFKLLSHFTIVLFLKNPCVFCLQSFMRQV